MKELEQLTQLFLSYPEVFPSDPEDWASGYYNDMEKEVVLRVRQCVREVLDLARLDSSAINLEGVDELVIETVWNFAYEEGVLISGILEYYDNHDIEVVLCYLSKCIRNNPEKLKSIIVDYAPILSEINFGMYGCEYSEMLLDSICAADRGSSLYALICLCLRWIDRSPDSLDLDHLAEDFPKVFKALKVDLAEDLTEGSESSANNVQVAYSTLSMCLNTCGSSEGEPRLTWIRITGMMFPWDDPHAVHELSRYISEIPQWIREDSTIEDFSHLCRELRGWLEMPPSTAKGAISLLETWNKCILQILTEYRNDFALTTMIAKHSTFEEVLVSLTRSGCHLGGFLRSDGTFSGSHSIGWEFFIQGHEVLADTEDDASETLYADTWDDDSWADKASEMTISELYEDSNIDGVWKRLSLKKRCALVRVNLHNRQGFVRKDVIDAIVFNHLGIVRGLAAMSDWSSAELDRIGECLIQQARFCQAECEELMRDDEFLFPESPFVYGRWGTSPLAELKRATICVAASILTALTSDGRHWSTWERRTWERQSLDLVRHLLDA